MERCSISPHIGFIPLWSFLLVTVIFCTATGDTNDRKLEELGEMQMPVTAQATTTQLWAVVWGPTQPPEDETHHFLSSLETESRKMTTSEDLSHHRGQPANQTQQPTTGEEERKDTEEQETQEVDPQFYVTVTISSLLILSAVIISAKLCYDRSLSHRPPPLSLSIPRAIAQEDSRQTLHSTPSFPDRERIPVVNL
ncbi:PILR alpha-associated neural protein isoform X1 [Triplophysa dalaica]|uniref:PILR alpha-associated neural protein isoform X1 n=2 Tax=Triplophysa dalaica TaxID=1582913 RepID=UPI0024DF990A|nr:PILR alpha-associated neural protein isoform X1 [Triplophysa dalaica]XP_056618655.1 PILR alpha-associated neural protein isoform X1 [Triplophysa dalaica]